MSGSTTHYLALASRRKVAAFATLYLVLIPIGLDRIWRWVTALIAA